MQRKPPTPSRLEIFLLGPFRARVDGAEVKERRWERRQAKLLVKALALQPHHELHREELIELLWPEADAAAAMSSLHRTIHLARRALEPELRSGAQSAFLRVREERVLLTAPDALWVDAEQFERSAVEALKGDDPNLVSAALELYAEDLLAEDPYEDWAARHRERLRGLYRDLLVRTANRPPAGDGHQASIARLRKLFVEDPLDEEAARALMGHYVRSGQESKATGVYRRCREVLASELGAEPEPATEALHRAILSGRAQTVTPEARRAEPEFRQLTFRRGWIQAARLSGDGGVVGAAWEGEPLGVFETRPGSPDFEGVRLPGAGLLACTASGDVLVALRRRFLRGYVSDGTLARLDPATGRLDELAEGVQYAECSPADGRLLIVRDVGGRSRLESPPGTPVYAAAGWISHPRFSPDGERIALLEHPIPADDGGAVVVIDRHGLARVLSGGWLSAQGLSWSPDGGEVWFTATRAGNARALHAVSLDGRERLIYRGAGALILHDVARDGRVLLTREHTRLKIAGCAPGGTAERDLSWHDWSLARDLSADGRTLLFTEAGEGGGASYGVYVRGTDGAPTARLGDGSALALSPDGRWALTKLTPPSSGLVLLPTGGGAPRPLEGAGLAYEPWGCWLPDGRRVLFAAREPNRGTRLYLQSVGGGAPRAMTPAGDGVELTSPHAVSPDGSRVVAVGADERVSLYLLDGGAPEPLPGAEKGDLPICWSADGGALYVRRRGEAPVVIYRLELTTGRRVVWQTLTPASGVGLREVLRVLLRPELGAYAYTYTQELSELFECTGLL